MKLCLAIIFFSLIHSPLWAQGIVRSEEDFYMHMRNHVNNVSVLGEQLIALSESDPEVRKMLGVPEGEKINESLKQLTRDFLNQHDASKLNTSKEFLAKYNSGSPIIGELYKIYGRSFKELTEKEKEIVVRLVNGTDDMEKSHFVSTRNLPAWKVKFIEQVEKIADFTERGKNPLTSEEMGRASFKESEGIKNLIAKTENPAEKKVLEVKLRVVEKLEANYESSAKSYADFKKEAEEFKKALQASQIYSENLDKYSLYQIQKDFKLSAGNKDLKTFLYGHSNYASKIKSMIKPSQITEGSMMIELGKIDFSKSKNVLRPSRYQKISEILAGECAK